MMFERFTPDARTIVGQAVQHARRLGHRYVGGEHILLAAVSAGQPASSILCAHGITPELVEEEIVRRVGLGAGAGLFGALDRDALASIGIDIDAVRARIEASFGPQALTHAAQAIQGGARRSRWPSARRSRRPKPARRLRLRRRGRPTASILSPKSAEAPGRHWAPGPLPGSPPSFTPAAKKILEISLREAVALHDSHIGVEHIALALTSVRRGLVPPILAGADAPAPALRAAILDRYRRAS
jgi:hypothetical protein